MRKLLIFLTIGLGIAVVAGCGSAQQPILGTIKGIAAPCAGTLRGHVAAVTVEVFAGTTQAGTPVATSSAHLPPGDGFIIRVRPGTYTVVAKGSLDRGRVVTVKGGTATTQDFPSHC